MLELTGMGTFEGQVREGSCSSVASFGEWCQTYKHEGEPSRTNSPTKQRNPARTGIFGFVSDSGVTEVPEQECIVARKEIFG